MAAPEWNSIFAGKADAFSGVLTTPTIISPLITSPTISNPTFSTSVTLNGLTLTGGVNGDISAGSVTATGSSSARALASRAADVANVLDYGAKGDGLTDDTTAIRSAITSNKRVWLPYTGHTYEVTGTLTLGTSDMLVCDLGVTIHLQSGTAQMLSVTGSGASIRDCLFDQRSATTAFGSISSDHFYWDGGGTINAGQLTITGVGAAYNKIARAKFSAGTSTVIDITANANHNSILNSEFQNNTGFGVRIDTGANANLAQGNWTDSNGIELIGITYNAYDNTISNNRAQGTGDNCISITGYNNRVTGNMAYGCAFTGIYVYGNGNTLVGNTAMDNGQVHNPSFRYYNAGNNNSYAGINISGGFGGAGQNNIATGNFIDDDQTSKTQAYGQAYGGGYAAWVTNTVYAANAYVYNAGNIYQTTAGGTSGASAPTCTSGTCSDGAVTWTYISTTPLTTRETAGNTLGPNTVYRFLTSLFNDGTVNHSNTTYLEYQFQQSGLRSSGANTITGGFTKKVGTNWAQGIAVHYGDLVFTSSGSNLYRVINAGGTTGSSQPTCTSGNCITADSIQWLFVQSGPLDPHIVVNTSNILFNATLEVPVVESNQIAYCPIFAGTGSPAGKVTAPPCALYLNSSGGASTTLYVKESGIDSSGWVAK